MKIHESAENYLESIYILHKEQTSVRSIDVANHLGFSKPSVSVAMKALREEDYVTVDDDGNLSLTEKGLKIAEKLFERHQLIAKALMALGVSKETAYLDSCKIEHDISDESFNQIKAHICGEMPDAATSNEKRI